LPAIWARKLTTPITEQPTVQKKKSIKLLPQSHFGTRIFEMRVIAVSTLRDFWARHPDAQQPLKAWFEEASHAAWQQPSDIKALYRNASILRNRRVVFNIKGNDYRLVVAIAYQLQVVYIKFVGTHKEYDAIDAQTIEPS
jgi:mRNA interferase HigB